MNHHHCTNRFSWRSHHRLDHGFTLVEVLASLMLISIVLPVALRAISVAAANASLAAQRTEAAALAQMKLNEVIIARDYDVREQEGDFGDEWPSYQWRAATSKWSGPSLLQVDTTVSWVHGGMERSLTLSSLVFDDQSQ